MPGLPSDKRCILHADMDAFYASVEQRDHPELRGKPVAVGGSSQRGVVSAASYEARVYGVRSAMPSFEAKRLCPDLIFLQGDMASYSRESRRIFEIFGEFSPSVEGLSLDEAFLDLTGTERLMGAPRGIGERLRARVRSETGLVVSVGIAPIKMVAKIASAACKPDGLLEVSAAHVRDFLDPLAVRRIWGVGPVAERRLIERGMQTVGDLARADDSVLERLFGDWGLRLARLARGVDLREIEPHRAAISYSEENTFARDIGDYSGEGVLGVTILTHAESVARRLRRDGVRARTVVLKWREAKRAAAGPRGYPLHTRQSTLFEATDDGDAIAREARRLLAEVGPREPVRLIGVGVSNIETEGGARQLALFDGREASAPTAEADGKRDQLNRALDEITDRFGRDAVTRASQGKADRAGLTLQIKRGERPNPERGKPD